MEHIGMDLGKRESQIAILTEEGELIEKRIHTERTRLSAVFGARPKARILLEAATESEWVARCLEALGHEVIVADPNYAPMYAQRSRRIKTDRRDARALVSACKSGTYKPAHRTSDARRHLRALLAVREGLVRTRARWIGLTRTLLRRDGFRIRSGAPDSFLARVAELGVPAPLRAEIAPLLTLFAPVNDQIKALDEWLAALVRTDEVLQRLTTVPGVGPVTAISFVATVDDVQRFRGAHQVQSYLGLVPQEWSRKRDPAQGPHHEGRQLSHALAPGGGRLGHSPRAEKARHCPLAGVGRADPPPPRGPDCRSGPRPARGWDPLRHVAR